MRVRGLKHDSSNTYFDDNDVAPHAGAWIETLSLRSFSSQREVAPHAGAWIETAVMEMYMYNRYFVAPHAGAWIETYQK